MMNLKKDYKYALVVPTSMGVRICPQHGQPVHSADLFAMQAIRISAAIVTFVMASGTN